jgi:hypothetical protein
MARLTDKFYLGRAGAYPDPLNTNDLLPVVYGDLTDGDDGVWRLPRIDLIVGTPNTPVYCYAAHETLSAANGNTVTIYEDGMELDPGLYAFNEADDYESLGTISTITFTSPKDNAVITARGKGKPTAAAGATLMENIIDIVEDFLTVENDFTSALFEATAKARASQIFTAQSYKAAGVIHEDGAIWEIIAAMMGSFLGSCYINGDGELVLEIDTNIVPLGPAGIIRKGDAYLTDAVITRDNIINQCPCNYAYDYVTAAFRSHTDAADHVDAASQGIFGVRKPGTPYQFYWCRDLTSVQTVQDLIVAKLARPLYEVTIAAEKLKQIALDIGDYFAWSAHRLYDQNGEEMLNQYWKTIAVRPDYPKNRIVLRALQTAHFMTTAYLADGTYLADGSVIAGGNRDLTAY